MAVVISFINATDNMEIFDERSVIYKNWTIANLIDDLCAVYTADTDVTSILSQGRALGAIGFCDMDEALAKRSVRAMQYIITESLKESPSVELPCLNAMKESNREFYQESLTGILEYLDKESGLVWGPEFAVESTATV